MRLCRRKRIGESICALPLLYYQPQVLLQPRLRRRQSRLRLTMVITTGTRDAVMDTELQLIGPVYVVSYSLQPQHPEAPPTCSISY